MSVLDEEALKKQLKSGEIKKAYLIFGEEPYLKKHYTELIVSKSVTGSFQDFNLHRFEGDALMNDIVQACEALPMMSERTCIVVHDLREGAMPADDFDAFMRTAEDLPDSTVLVLWQDTVTFSSRSTARAGKLVKLFDAVGCACELKKRTGTALYKPLISGAAKRGCKLDNVTAGYLVSVVGDDYNTLLNELEKLCFYAQGEITKKTVDEVCVKSLEASAFDLARALISGNAEKAYRLLDTLFARKVESTLIMGALIGAYVDMYRAKVAVTNGHKPEFFASCFNYRNKEFRLKNGARDASNLSTDQLRQSLDILSAADLSVKASYGDQSGGRLSIEKAMMQLLLTANRQ